MKKFQFLIGCFTVILLFHIRYGYAQNPTRLDPTVFTIVEQPPAFPGGFSALKEYMQKNVQYPPEAKKAHIKDRVFMSFIVERDGSLSNIQLLKGIGYGCDEEAVRVVKMMPRWTPGSQSGQALRVKYNLPVLFGIDYPKGRAR